MNPALIGSLIGFVIGIAMVACAAWFFWNRAKREPLRILESFSQAHGLSVVEAGPARCEVAGILGDLHTNLVVTLGQPPHVRSISRLPQALPYKFRAVSMVANRDFTSTFDVEADERAHRDALTGNVRDALMQLRANTKWVELTEDAISWVAPATPSDLKRIPALHSMAKGVILALGHR